MKDTNDRRWKNRNHLSLRDRWKTYMLYDQDDDSTLRVVGDATQSRTARYGGIDHFEAAPRQADQ